MAKDIFIDVETYSSVDLSSCGSYKCIESPDFEILLIGYALDGGAVQVIDLVSGDELPEEFEEALFDPNCKKHAHNASFERRTLARIGFDIPIEQWHCTAVKAAYCGLTFALDKVSKILDLTHKKLDSGKLLIKYFSCPCKPTKTNGRRLRNYPHHAPDKWQLYIDYNREDVEAEREIYYILEKYEIPLFERELYKLDQEINDKGVLVDMDLAASAVYVNEVYSEILKEKAIKLTGITNPNSVAQVKSWIEQQTGIIVASLDKKSMPQVLEDLKDFPKVLEFLKIKASLSKNSIKKYTAMLVAATSDNRVKGTFQFYGANRTGRWAGRLLQLQNLSKNYLDDLDLPRGLTRSRDWDALEMIYGDVSNILSQLVRTALIAPEGHTFAVADFSAIEARVISWLADEEWRMEVFRGDGKIYEAAGAKMFNVPISAITKTSELRFKAKTAELALGYQGSLGAMKNMGGEKMGMSDVEMMDIVRKWRKANPKIVSLWQEVEEAAMQAIKTYKPVTVTKRELVMKYDGLCLTITLPSGRKLFYYKPVIQLKQVGKSSRTAEAICYQGVIQKTNQWGLVDTYGGKLIENIVQAIARDLLGTTMLNLYNNGFLPTMHIHDEFILEILKDGSEKDVYNEIIRLASLTPVWANDFPLVADGYITDFYKKD